MSIMATSVLDWPCWLVRPKLWESSFTQKDGLGERVGLREHARRLAAVWSASRRVLCAGAVRSSGLQR